MGMGEWEAEFSEFSGTAGRGGSLSGSATSGSRWSILTSDAPRYSRTVVLCEATARHFPDWRTKLSVNTIFVASACPW